MDILTHPALTLEDRAKLRKLLLWIREHAGLRKDDAEIEEILDRYFEVKNV